MRLHHFILAAAFLVCGSFGDAARAEVFRLKNGGEVEGEWLNRDESPRKQYLIRTRGGGQLALAASAVHAPQPLSDAERKYQEVRSKYANTVEAQWELAEFCRTSGLPKLRELHLRQILELDPDHSASRVALGFTRHNGKWTTQKEKMAEQGYFYHDGSYRTRQEIAMVEQLKQSHAARRSWTSKLKKLRGSLNDKRREDEARDSILEIKDPAAVDAIGDMIAGERSREVKLILVDALANIEGQAPVFLLAKLSLDDKDEEVRATARDHLERIKSPFALDYFIRELRSKDNARINRAAQGLEKLGERSAVQPLIEALITKHQFKVTKGNPGQIGGTFGGPGGGTFSSGGSVSIETKNLVNSSVLDALRSLTDVDFDQNVEAWRRWYASKRQLDFINARRDGE